MKTDLFQSCGHCWVFQMCWHIECSTFTASSFRIWNSSTGIPSPPLAFFGVMLSKRPTWLHIPGCLAVGEWSHHRDYLGREDLFCRLFFSRLLQSPNLSSLSHTENSHGLSVFHKVMCMFLCYSLPGSHPLRPPRHHILKSVLSVCVSTVALHMGSSLCLPRFLYMGII